MGTQQKKKKRTEDTRAVVTEIKRENDQDTITLALQPTFELGYSPLGAGTISFCNVTASVNTSLQGVGIPAGDTTPPAQVTGLAVGSPSASSLDLSWTASAAGDLDHYNVYRGTVAGFTVTPGSTTPTGLPITNSFTDSGLTASTTYYYKVLAADTSNNLGTLSAEASGTTSAGAGITPSLWLKLDNSLADSSGNSNNTVCTTTAVYATPGKFGSHYYLQNAGATSDYLTTTNSSSTQLDFTNGFSYSFWIYPTSITSAIIVDKAIDVNNFVEISMGSGGAAEIVCAVYKAGTSLGKKFPATSIAINTWYHIVLTYNASTNTVTFYKDKVAATTSNAAGFGANHTDLLIGNGKTALNVPFKGRIDEFQYFKGTVLTQTQVNNLFATNAP